MNRKTASIVALTFAAFAIAPQAGAKGGTATLMPADGIKWSDVPNFPGVKMGTLQGDPGKGAAHFMMKLPGGFTSPPNHHPSDHYVTVVSGTISFTVDGKDTKLPAGSYFAFTGKKPHVTRCEAGADCVLAVDSRGKWDVLVEGAKPAAKK